MEWTRGYPSVRTLRRRQQNNVSEDFNNEYDEDIIENEDEDENYDGMEIENEDVDENNDLQTYMADELEPETVSEQDILIDLQSSISNTNEIIMAVFLFS
eukprot:Pompholyxophrys_sp_v1_NODE_26_length_3750_cov_7.232206.p7 type:complete len:100 gc:universal NODE_26_length_3750_cov_7.232206:1869-1570(-)